MSRRTCSANAVCLSNKHDILCLTETWLTDEVRSETLFIPEFKIYRCDRPSKNYNTKHGGVLIAIRNNSHVPINSNIEQVTLRLIDFENISSLICCVNYTPKDSPHRPTAFSIVDFLTKISATAKDLNCEKIMITGDINFSKTDWKAMASDDPEEDLILETLIDHNFEQILAPETAKSLDIFLVNNPSLIINSFIDENVFKMYSIENKNLSDHNAFTTEINLNHRLIVTRSDDKVKYAFERADWSAINTTIINNPFTPFCFSNCDFLLDQWYTWLLRILEKNIPRVTEHRATLPPWITPPTSHLIKRKETLLRKQQSCPKPELLSKTTNLEKIKISAGKDLKNYELQIFAPRKFSTIQKYLPSIRRAPRLPSIMKLDGKELKTDKEKCDAFNQFFCSVFTKAEQITELSIFEKANTTTSS